MSTWPMRAGERGRVVAHLVGVRKDYVVRRALVLDELLQSGAETVGRVMREQRMLDADHLADGPGGCLGSQRLGLCADDYGRDALPLARAVAQRQAPPNWNC